MSERDDYAPGVPCWVDTWQADAAATAAFYAELMGWETERTTPDDAEAQYVMCRLRGRDVAAIGSGVAGAGASASAAGATAPAAGASASGAGASASGAGASGSGAGASGSAAGASVPAAGPAAGASGVGGAGASASPAGPGASPAGTADTPAAWTTYVQVASVEDTVAKAREAGGAIVAPPFDSLDGGRIAILADPAGATFGVWAPGAHRGAQLVNEPGAWTMSVLLCDDPEPAKRFYGATLGWTGDPFPLGDAEGTLFRLDGYVGGEPSQPVPRDVVAVMAPASGRPAGWVAGFWVDDADATAARAPELGGTVVAGPFDTAISRDAVIADPGGAVFSVSTAPPAAR